MVEIRIISRFRSLFVKEKIEPLSLAMNEIAKGLETYGLMKFIKNYPDVFFHVFCPSTLLNWTTNLFFDKLSPTFSEDGSTKKETEINVFKWFKDFIERCFEDGNFFAYFSKVLYFSLLLIFIRAFTICNLKEENGKYVE